MNDSLILGSSSRYRANLLKSLRLPFAQVSPEIDETALVGESAPNLATRLALSKAMHIAEQHVGAVVIGSDQVGQCGPHLLSKPGTAAAAIRSLQSTNGQLATFYTAVSLVRISADGKAQSTSDVCVTELKFRQLTDAQIAQYVDQDQPLDAAGAFKAESLGIALFEFIRADDPSALIGLPLITVATRLQQFGLDPLNPPVPSTSTPEVGPTWR